MTREEAYQRLELPDGAGIEAVQKQFDALCEGWRVQTNTASTFGMRQVFEEQLNQLKEAYSLLTGSDGVRGKDVSEPDLSGRQKFTKRTLLIVGLYVTVAAAITVFVLQKHYRQQSRITNALNEAIAAAKEGDEPVFNDRLAVFWNEDGIKPEELSKEKKHLYTEALYQGFFNGNLDPSDKVASRILKYIQKDVEDDPQKMVLLGLFYSLGKGIEQNYALARKWWKKAAEKGDALAMFRLGSLYGNGVGVTLDYAKAKYWYEKAVEKGNVWAMYDLGHLYASGYGVTQDYERTQYWWEKAAEAGHTEAMINLGTLYVVGKGVKQDYAKAKSWFEKAADKEYPKAMHNLGLLYANGYGVTQDYDKTKYWFERAAEAGHAESMFNLGVLYLKGYGVPRNYDKVIYWWEQATEKGYREAMLALEFLYRNGKGVARDEAKADYWAEKAKTAK